MFLKVFGETFSEGVLWSVMKVVERECFGVSHVCEVVLVVTR